MSLGLTGLGWVTPLGSTKSCVISSASPGIENGAEGRNTRSGGSPAQSFFNNTGGGVFPESP